LLLSRVIYTPGIKRENSTLSESELTRTYFNFNGNEILQSSFFYNLNLNGVDINGEYALSDFKNMAISQSALFKADCIKFGLNYWRLDKSFQSPHGRSFDDSSPFPRGKEGYYGALSLKISNNLLFRAYKLFEQDLWRSYFSPLPLKKSEWFAELEFKKETARLFARYRFKRKEDYIGAQLLQPPQLIADNQYIYRLQANLKINSSFKSRTRWEYTELVNTDEKGTLLFQDFSYSDSKMLTLSARITFFHTSSYNSRIYEYENDLPGSFSNYALHGDGYKWYMLFKIRLSDYLLAYIKYRYYNIQTKEPNYFTFSRPEGKLSRELRLMLKIIF